MRIKPLLRSGLFTLASFVATSALALSINPRPADALSESRPILFTQAVATVDEDWQTRLEDPSGRPTLTTSETIERGQVIHILAFFTGAAKDGSGLGRLNCDIRFQRPDGSFVLNDGDMSCFNQPLFDPAHIRRVSAVIRFTGDANDPSGVWTYRVSIRDRVSGQTSSSKVSFTLK